MQEEFKSDALFLWWCLPSILKPRPNDSNISTQHIPTMLAQHLQAPAKRLQHCLAQHVVRVWPPCVATCCELKIVLAHMPQGNVVARTLFTRLQHHAASTNVAWKIWPFSNLSQQHQTCRNMSQHAATGWPHKRNMLHPTTLGYVALKCSVEMLWSFARGFANVGPTMLGFNRSWKRGLSKALFKAEELINAGWAFSCGWQTLWKRRFLKTFF